MLAELSSAATDDARAEVSPVMVTPTSGSVATGASLLVTETTAGTTLKVADNEESDWLVISGLVFETG